MNINKFKNALLALLLQGCALLAQDSQKIAVKLVDEADSKGAPIKDAQVVVIMKSGVHLLATWDDPSGEYRCETKAECHRVFVAAVGYEACVEKFSRGTSAFSVKLKKSVVKSSAIIIGVRGSLPGIEGTLEPVLDNLRRTYLYTKMIRLESKGRPALQPLNFTIGKPIDAVAPSGVPFKLWFIDMTQDVSLVEYTRPK